MTIKTILTAPFDDQNSGTSGLRKKVSVFQRPHYVENYIQSVFHCAGNVQGKRLIVGGDGRYYNCDVIQKILKMAAAHGFGRVIVGQGGLLSTPAASHLIRKFKAHGGLILSASHNPGGKDGDFGIKYNVANGGPAPQTVTDAIYQQSKQIQSYKILEAKDIKLDQIGVCRLGDMVVEVIDPVCDYADLMETLFDFAAIRKAIQDGLTFQFDAMHAVTGPYAVEIFENRLGFPAGTAVNVVPQPDFAGCHPDPNLVHAQALYQRLMAPHGPDLGAASDGDGDRNLIIGNGQFITPSDSLAIIAAHASKIKGYQAGITGIARSMPTGSAADYVADALHVDLYETPTGWKFFANLLDTNKITFCGEESFGTGSSHVREKDGLWAVLYWLNLLAVTRCSVKEIAQKHWQKFGRCYYSRHDYEAVNLHDAHTVMHSLRARFSTLPGQTLQGLEVKKAEDFSYHDPVDASITSNQGIRIIFCNGDRLIYRLSGTGTVGATLRIYMEHYEQNLDKQDDDTQSALAQLIIIADQLVALKTTLKRDQPDIIT